MFRKRIAVINLGLGSYGAEQSRLALERFSRSLGNPAYCLYLGSDNDLDDDLLFRNGARHRQLVRGNPRWHGFAEPLAWLGNLQLSLRLKLALAERRLMKLRSAALQVEGRDAAKVQSPASVGRARSVAEVQWPSIQRIVNACRSRGAKVIVSWIPRVSLDSYRWLQAKSLEDGLSFNDWHPAVASTLEAIPNMPVNNPHSGGHYRGWIAGRIAQGFYNEMSVDPTGR